jgi:hypothetical protein
MSDPFWLTASQMARLEPYFPKSHGVPRVDDRRVLSGICRVLRNGMRRRFMARTRPSATGLSAGFGWEFLRISSMSYPGSYLRTKCGSTPPT